MTTIVQSAMTAAVPVPDLSSLETQLAVQNLRSVINNNSAYIRAVDAVADEFGDVTGISPVTVAGGYVTGDRQSSITMSWNDQSSTAWNPSSSLSVAIDGNTSSGHLYPNGTGSAAVANTWIQFEFAIAIYISEIKEYYAVTTANSDKWKWQGSLDGTTWIDITDTTNWGGNPTTQTRAITASAGPYNYLRKHGVSGSNVGSTGLLEVEFNTYATGDSINTTYDATSDYYTNDFVTGTRITGATPTAHKGGTAANVNDGNTGTEMTSSSLSTSSPGDFDDSAGVTGTYWIKLVTLDFGSAVAAGSWQCFMDRSDGTQTGYACLYSNDNSTWSMVPNGVNASGDDAMQTGSLNGTISARYWALCTGGSPGYGSITLQCHAFNILTPNVFNNATIISNTFTAETAPTEASAVFLHQPIVAVTLNTDILGYISRDNGTTWTQGTLVDAGSFDNTTNILTMNAVDISGQPSGTSMRYKIVTANAKEQRLHGAWLAWS